MSDEKEFKIIESHRDYHPQNVEHVDVPQSGPYNTVVDAESTEVNSGEAGESGSDGSEDSTTSGD